MLPEQTNVDLSSNTNRQINASWLSPPQDFRRKISSRPAICLNAVSLYLAVIQISSNWYFTFASLSEMNVNFRVPPP